MDGRGGPTVARLALGALLRSLRNSAEMDGDEAARLIQASPSKISRIESGQVPVSARDIKDLLDLYRVEEKDQNPLLQLAREGRAAGWWDDFSDVLTSPVRRALALESEASLIRVYDPLAVPAMLQTADYARAIALNRGPDDLVSLGGLDLRVLARRRAVIAPTIPPDPPPPRVWALIHESALETPPPGDHGILRAQLASLQKAAAQQHITVQIVPHATPATLSAPGRFTLLRFGGSFGGSDVKDAVLIEETLTIRSLERLAEIDRHHQVWNDIANQSLQPGPTKRILGDIDRFLKNSRAAAEERRSDRRTTGRPE